MNTTPNPTTVNHGDGRSTLGLRLPKCATGHTAPVKGYCPVCGARAAQPGFTVKGA